jgi:hypothetical protein
MRLKEATPEVVDRLREKLRRLEGLRIVDCFNQYFPHLNSPISGSVQFQSTPIWYTYIHDSLEELFVEYNEEDIKNQDFLEIKLCLIPGHLLVYLLKEGSPDPVIQLTLGVKVEDLENGTFQFTRPLVQELHIFETFQQPASNIA